LLRLHGGWGLAFIGKYHVGLRDLCSCLLGFLRLRQPTSPSCLNSTFEGQVFHYHIFMDNLAFIGKYHVGLRDLYSCLLGFLRLRQPTI